MDSLKKTWLGKNLPWFGRWSILLGISAGGFFTYNLLQNLSAPNFWDISGLFTLGVLGTWRWPWWITQVICSRIYLHWISYTNSPSKSTLRKFNQDYRLGTLCYESSGTRSHFEQLKKLLAIS